MAVKALCFLSWWTANSYCHASDYIYFEAEELRTTILSQQRDQFLLFGYFPSIPEKRKLILVMEAAELLTLSDCIPLYGNYDVALDYEFAVQLGPKLIMHRSRTPLESPYQKFLVVQFDLIWPANKVFEGRIKIRLEPYLGEPISDVR